jgi:entericidin B
MELLISFASLVPEFFASISIKDSSMKATTTLLAILATVFSLSLAACNTVEGVGEDVRSAGDAIDDASEDARRD